MPGLPEQLPQPIPKEDSTSDEVDVEDDLDFDDTFKRSAIKHPDKAQPVENESQKPGAEAEPESETNAVPTSDEAEFAPAPKAIESATIASEHTETQNDAIVSHSTALVKWEPRRAWAEFEAPLETPSSPAIDEPETITVNDADSEHSQLDVALPPRTPAPSTAASLPQPDRSLPGTRRLPPRAVFSLVLLAVVLISSLLLWHDVAATHLSAYTLDPVTGQLVGQVNMGGSYAGQSFISAPVQEPGSPSTVFFSVAHTQAAAQAEQQVVELQGSGTSWRQTQQFNTSLTRGSLSVTARGELVVASASELEVSTANGQPRWHVSIKQPTLGAHAFQPAFDGTTLYTVKAAASGQIAAYNLQNGTPLWTATVRDTLNYAAPLLLDGTTLYVAGDHAIFALNSRDGSLLWTALHPARTLLPSGSGSQRLLIAASADGLLALNPGNGSLAWSYRGQRGTMMPVGVLSLTPTQFYQASIADDTIYATGVAWKAPEIREELWLYAVDAATGNIRWTRQVGSDIASADAGRIYTPAVDSSHHLVLLEQQLSGSDLALSAFDASSGAARWHTRFQNITAASPTLLEPSGNALLFLCAQADNGITLLDMTPLRFALLALLLLSVLGLLFLIFQSKQLMAQSRRGRFSGRSADLSARGAGADKSALGALKRPLRDSTGIVLSLLVLIIAALAASTLLQQGQDSVYQVAAHSGATQWRQATSPATELLAANTEGSILATTEETNLQQLRAVNSSGSVLWQTVASEGLFSLPTAPTRSGVVLLALSGHAPLHYQFAPDDPAYPHPLDSLLMLSLLNRSTGQPIWQSVIVNPDEQQNAVVLGADAQYIYVASMQANNATNSGAAVQLLAVDQASGIVAWRIFGPSEPVNAPRDHCTLLLQGQQIIWQVAGAVYAIDAETGQIQWRRSFGSDDPRALLQAEGQLVEANGLLLVGRSKTIYALDPASGNQLWTMPALGSDAPSSAAGIASAGNTLLIYGNGQIEALDLRSRHITWRKRQSGNMHSLTPSDDGKFIYLVLTGSGSGGANAPTQTLLALDRQTGATRWTWQPSAASTFDNRQAGAIVERHGIVLAATSFSGPQGTSAGENLYALDATTGATRWQVSARTISNVQLSPDGSSVTFQKNSS